MRGHCSSSRHVRLCGCITTNQRRCVPTFWLLPGHLPTTRSRTLQMWASGTFSLAGSTPSPVVNVWELQSAWLGLPRFVQVLCVYHVPAPGNPCPGFNSFGISKSWADGNRREGVLAIIVPRCL